VNQSGTHAPTVLLGFIRETCYFSTMSDRMFAQSCPNCGGICPLQAQTCEYCKFRFSGARTFSLNSIVPRKGFLRFAVIILAIVMVAVLLVINVLN